MSKFSNSIVVGGPIAVGKSTLVGALPFIPVQELESNDELQKLLLEKMYEGDLIAPQIFQLDMLLTRFDKYKRLANDEKMHVFDRSIFEDVFFAKNLLKKYSVVWDYYKSIWDDKVKDLIETIGLPKMYILLECDWDHFKKRLLARNRKPEIDNFVRNETYFKEMIQEYPKFMEETFKKYEIPFTVINTNGMSRVEVIDHATEELKKVGIL